MIILEISIYSHLLQDLQYEIDSLESQVDYLKDSGEGLASDLDNTDDIAAIADKLSEVSDR